MSRIVIELPDIPVCGDVNFRLFASDICFGLLFRYMWCKTTKDHKFLSEPDTLDY